MLLNQEKSISVPCFFFLRIYLQFFSQVVSSPYRIIAMCGDYYIGGRRFSSLSDLIGYYSYVSCLLKGEKLLSPVAPPEVRLNPEAEAFPWLV